MSDLPKSGPLIADRTRIIWPVRPIFRTKNRGSGALRSG